MKESVRNRAAAMKKINDLTLRGEIVIFGSTYMSFFPLYEFINKCTFENAIYNRSIEGLTIKEAAQIVDGCVLDIHPNKVFLALGEEDENDPEAITGYTRLVEKIRSRLPECTLFLIGLPDGGKYAEDFNRNLLRICDGKTVKPINFIKKNVSETALYRARFKQLSCFFRNKPLTMSDAFDLECI